WDKPVLFASMILVYAALTALIGRLGSARPRLAAVLLAALGLFAMALVLTRAQNSALDVLPTAAGTVVAVPTLLLLLRAVRAPAPSGDADAAWSRRRTLVGVGALGVLAVVTAASARAATARRELA